MMNTTLQDKRIKLLIYAIRRMNSKGHSELKNLSKRVHNV